MKIIFIIIGLFAVGNALMNEEGKEKFDEYAARTIRQRILNEQLDRLQKESQALEEVYGPVSDWVNGSKHHPGFLRSAINQHKGEALERVIYLGQRICIAKSLSKRAFAISASTKHSRKMYLTDHQDELCEKAQQAVSRHFEPIIYALQKLQQAETNKEVDEVTRDFLKAKPSLVAGIPSVY